MNILLIHPPVVKPCEPPAGPARLQGALKAHGIPCALWDASVECLLALMETATGEDVWSRRAVRNRTRNEALLRDAAIYCDPVRYHRAVSDLNRLLSVSAKAEGVRLSLSDYREEGRSALTCSDLLEAAEHPERNPFYCWFAHRLADLLARAAFTHIGFSLNYLSQAATTFAMIGFVRKAWPGLRIIIGGGLVTSWMRRVDLSAALRGRVDHVIAGPGEASLLALSGSACRQDISFLPCYDDISWESYLAPGPILPYSASSGCWWRRCAFCPEQAEGNGYHPVAPLQAVDELTRLTEHLRPSLVHLLDNAISPALMEALCRADLGVPWYGFARFTDHLADPAFCHALRQSGCRMLQLGLESGDQGVLDALDKGIELTVAAKALRALKAAGIGTYVYLLFDTPAEDEAAARKTLAFTAQHSDSIDFLNVAIFNLPVDTMPELERRAFYDGDLSLYTDFVHPKGWDRKHVRRFIEKEFKAHPAIRPIILRDPPWFTSNHAPLMI